MRDSRANRPVSERTCVCGHIAGSRGWYTRHVRKCAQYQALPMSKLARHTVRAFTGRLTRNITSDSPLLKALMRPGR